MADEQTILMPILIRLNHAPVRAVQEQIKLDIAGQEQAKFQTQGGSIVMIRKSVGSELWNILYQYRQIATPNDTLILMYVEVIDKDMYNSLNVKGTLLHMWGLKPYSTEVMPLEAATLDWSKPSIYLQQTEKPRSKETPPTIVLPQSHRQPSDISVDESNSDKENVTST